MWSSRGAVVLALVALGCGSEDSSRIRGAAKGGASGSDSGMGGTAIGAGGIGGGGRGAGGSTSGVVLCASDKTCTPLGKLCDTALSRCVDCLRDSDCTGTATCRAGVCQARVACRNSLECANAPNGRGICDAAAGDCVQCVSNADCDSGQACSARLCVPAGGGGVTGAGGMTGAGGVTGFGGLIGLGGAIDAGGVTGAGGVPDTGGAIGAGGTTSTGGAIGDGGTLATGGNAATGGGPAGTPCARLTDCTSRVCAGRVCQQPTCEDGITNGGETGTDCGGPCAVCRYGNACTVGTTCASGVCTLGTGGASGTCALGGGCGNSLKDNTETDVDCGGLSCAKCGAGKACRTPGDCNTRVCTAGRCATCNPDFCQATVFPACCTSAGACATLGFVTTICI